jgi:hypothetical protein
LLDKMVSCCATSPYYLAKGGVIWGIGQTTARTPPKFLSQNRTTSKGGGVEVIKGGSRSSSSRSTRRRRRRR